VLASAHGLFLFLSNRFFLGWREVLLILLCDGGVEQVGMVRPLGRLALVEDATQVQNARLVIHLVAQFWLLHLLSNIEIKGLSLTREHLAIRIVPLVAEDLFLVFIARSLHGGHFLTLLHELDILSAHSKLAAIRNVLCFIEYLGGHVLLASVNNHELGAALPTMNLRRPALAQLGAFGATHG